MPDEKLVIGQFDRDAKGDKVEPEQQPVERHQELPVDVSLGKANLAGGPPTITKRLQQKINTSVVTHDTAGDVALGFMRRCLNCANYNPDGWKQAKRAAEASGDIDQFNELNQIRSVLMTLQTPSGEDFQRRHMSDDGFNIEAALNDIGRCNAISELEKDDVFVLPTGRCPNGYDHCFKPKSGSAGRKAASGYDAIMRLAQGRRR